MANLLMAFDLAAFSGSQTWTTRTPKLLSFIASNSCYFFTPLTAEALRGLFTFLWLIPVHILRRNVWQAHPDFVPDPPDFGRCAYSLLAQASKDPSASPCRLRVYSIFRNVFLARLFSPRL
jgi:hypothetical protein